MLSLFAALSAYASANRSRKNSAGSSNPRAGSAISDNAIEIPIERDVVFGTVLIRAQVDAKPVVLILDTGSNVTALSTDIVRKHLIDPKAAPKPKLGLPGQGLWTMTTLEMGTRIWPHRRVVAQDTHILSSTYRQKIDGLLGLDFLRQFKRVQIDFERDRLILIP